LAKKKKEKERAAFFKKVALVGAIVFVTIAATLIIQKLL
jgi:hypothetical protein